MGRIMLEIEDKDLLELGKEIIKEEMEKTLKWMKVKGLLKSISKALNTLEIDYEKETGKIKEEAWNEYKKELSL